MLYDYQCPKCETVYEIQHSMSCTNEFECPECHVILEKQISSTFYVATGIKPTLEDLKEKEHRKKVKDPERAIKSRKKKLGHDAVGDPAMKSDSRHLIKGRTLAGQEKEVDKKEMIEAMAKDPLCVEKSLEVLKKAKK